MKRLTSLIAASLVLAIGLPTAQAVVVFQDNFDSYATQGDMDAVWPVLAGTTAGVTYDTVKLSQEQSVSPGNSAKAPAQPTGSLTLQRSSHDFPLQTLAAVRDKLSFSFDFYDSNAPAAAYREYAEIRSDAFGSGTNQLIAIGLSNNESESASGGPAYMGRILGYTPSTTSDPDGGPAESAGAAGSFFKLNDFGTNGARSPGWHNLKVEITHDDNTNTDYMFYVDNKLAEIVNNVGTSGSIRNYQTVVLGSALTNNNTPGYFDNVSVQYLAHVTGDYDNNGIVDGADYVVWNKMNGQSGTNLAADGDNSGTVDGLDYEVWRGAYGNVPSGSGSGGGLSGGAVPEPTSICLLLSSLAFVAVGRRRT